MPLQIYNTLTSKKELFETQEPGHAKVYVCGPTVYDHTHIGHARCYIVYDVLVRQLKQAGRVTYVRNVTDIDDKIIKRAKEAGEEPRALADRFWRAYSSDMDRLGNLLPDVEPKVSDHLGEIEALTPGESDAAMVSTEGQIDRPWNLWRDQARAENP